MTSPRTKSSPDPKKMNAPSQKYHFPHSCMYITPLNLDFFREKKTLQNRCVLTIIRCAKIQSFSRRLLNPSIFWGVPNPGLCLLCLFSGKFTSPNTGIKTQPRYPSDAKNDTIIISTSLSLLLTTTNIAD